MTTDASFFGASAVLAEIKEDGSEEIIQLFSKTFNDVETRYAIAGLESEDNVLVKLSFPNKLDSMLQGPFQVTKVFLGGSFKAEELHGERTVNLSPSKAVRVKMEKEEPQLSPVDSQIVKKIIKILINLHQLCFNHSSSRADVQISDEVWCC